VTIAGSTRWQPLRVGLVDLFFYDYQEFPFRDGRILFRGNNGTGKSKVLALTLPLLLDGDLTPSRVEPDGDRAKKMEWNLLLGGRYDERLGYTFLEFGRVTEDGEQVFTTLGIGIKAVAGRGIADRWFFVTSQRVGEDLELIGPTGTALTRERLIAAIGEHGQVTKVAEQYRRMIDERLFQLGTDRYASLVNMLIQLRQPQLSKKPDEAKLSAALADALTPVDQAVLADIAQAFHDLEQQRAELVGMRETRRHVSRFVDRYRHYAAVAARRQSAALRSAHHGHEDLGRQIAEVGRAITEAAETEKRASAALETHRTEQTEQNAIKEELTADPRLKNLADAQRHAQAAERAAAEAGKAVVRAAGQRDDRAARLERAVREAEQTRREVDPRPALAEAGRAGITSELEQLNLPDGPYNEDHLHAADCAARAAARRRGEAVRHVAEHNRRVAREVAELRTLRAKLVEATAERDAAGDRLGETQEALRSAAEQHVRAWEKYRHGLRVLELPDPQDTTLELWTETLDGVSPMRTAMREASALAERALATELAAAEAVAAGMREELAGHTAERDRLVSGEVAAPPVPYTRRSGLRQGPGVAFWQAIDFAPGVPDRERAGLEAALESAGLLDALILPDGRLLDGHDTVLFPAEPVPVNLTSVLIPSLEPERAVAEATVLRILESVGLGEQAAAAWVAADGRWRLGTLHGAWDKAAASYIGHAAREEARRRRIAELDALMADLKARISAGRETVAGVKQRQADLAVELTREPHDHGLREAHGQVSGAAGELRRAADKVERISSDVGFKQDDLNQAVGERDDAATELRLPVGDAELDAVGTAVVAYREAMSALLAAARVHLHNLRTLADWKRELATARSALAEAEQRARDEAERAAEERSRLTTLQGAIGASVEELRARLTTATQRLTELSVLIEDLEHRQVAARELRHKAEGRIEQLESQLVEATADRDTAVEDLRRFAGTGLLTLACAVELPESWAPTNAVEVARRAEEQLKNVDGGDDAWRRVQDDVSQRYSELAEALSRHGHQVSVGLEDWLLVTVQFQGKDRSPADLVALLDGEIQYRERLLSAKERDLLEEHLVNDVAGHLQELITDAEAQVRRMNEELAERPTSTGMKLRMLWQPVKDGPEGLAEARRRLLRQNPDLWTPADRAAVGAFLQRLIEAERARDEHGTWQEHLRKALDYRGWHRFMIERFQDGEWRPGTGPASGGERVLTVSLPLFAAASAKYRSAHPQAPRLIALDEAFAGVDDDARAKCLGLLTTFDLDVVMTSEREWGFYPTVPGLAAHHLVRRDGIDAVHVTSWEWDGHVPRRVAASATSGAELF
jgi:uncharacterized protein (TIGR02680 family)